MRRRVHPIALPVGPAPVPSGPIGAVLLQHRVVGDLVDLDGEALALHVSSPWVADGGSLMCDNIARAQPESDVLGRAALNRLATTENRRIPSRPRELRVEAVDSWNGQC